ncbi:BQ2448_7982 [Microbotryum intermedium]|uniref:ATP-dependent DNA helicase n=1 Tax=Microbotryum intermedium TaxID=269621 RepID=A0A238FSM6_9BASI|nr:BQ2448_7982 [Microbotryum intermedium]
MARPTRHQGGPTAARASISAPRRARIALEPLPVGASIRHDLGPLDAECVEYGGLHWSCEANGKGSFSACCSRGKVHLPESPQPPDDYRGLLDGLDHDSKQFRANARSYNNALAFTSLGGKFEQHKPANNGPPLGDQAVAFAQTWLLDPAQQPATRMSAASGANVNRGILQRLETILRRSNPLRSRVRCCRQIESRLGRRQGGRVQALAAWAPQPKTHDLPTEDEVAILCSASEDEELQARQELIVQVRSDDPAAAPRYRRVPDKHQSALPLRCQLLFPSGEDGFRHPIPLAGFDHAERAERRSRSQIDQDVHDGRPQRKRRQQRHRNVRDLEDETDDEDEGGESEDETTPMSKHDSSPVALADGPRRGRGGSTTVSRSQSYAFYLHVRRGTYSIAHRLRRLFCEFVIDGWASAENDRLSYIANHQEEMRLTSRAAIEDAVARGIPAERLGRSVILASTCAVGPRNVTQRFHDALRLVSRSGKPDLFVTFTCNPHWPEIVHQLGPGEAANDRPDIVARVFEAKLQALMDDVYGTRNRARVFRQVLSHIYVIEYQKRGLPHAHVLITLAADDRPMTADDRIVCAEIPDPDLYLDLHTTVTSSMQHGKCGAANLRQPCMEQPRGAAAARCKCHYPRARQDETTMNEDGCYSTYRRRFRFHVDKAGVRYDDGDVVPYSPYLCAKYDAHINVEICSTIGAIKYMYKYVYKGPDRAAARLEERRDTPGGGGGGDEGRNEIEEYVEGRYICAPETVHRLLGFSIGTLFPAVVRLPVHLEDHDVQCLPAGTRARYVRELLYVDVSAYFKWSTTSQRWVRRKYATRTVGRIYFASVKEGEHYYLRQILHIVQGPRSYDDLKRFEGRTYATFRAACAARGLLEDDGEYVTCLEEALPIQVGHQLRRLFATLLIYCHVAQPLRLFERFFDALADDAAYRLRTDLGIDDPSPALIRSWKRSRSFARPSLPTSRTACSRTTLAGSSSCSPRGGASKTFVENALLDAVRGQGLIALAVASSGVASLLLKGGRTAHATFRIPLNSTDTSSCIRSLRSQTRDTCSVEKESKLANLLRAASLIIWDEAPMAHPATPSRPSIACYATFATRTNGDFRQCLPVVLKGTEDQIGRATIANCPFWPSRFSHWLLAVGDGSANEDGGPQVKIPDDFLLPEHERSRTGLIAFMYDGLERVSTLDLDEQRG